MRLIEDQPIVPYLIDLDFKDKKELKKRFRREAISKIAEFIYDNHVVHDGEIRIIEHAQEFGVQTSVKIFKKDLTDPTRLRFNCDHENS